MEHLALTDEQQEGVNICADLSNTIACVTGQAGTGKTTIMRNAYNAVVEEFCYRHGIDADDYEERRSYNGSLPFSIALAAPTGRAAKRIEEATGINGAKTIHRLLRFSVPIDDEDKGLPVHDRMNPMPHDVIFIDEASMLTSELRKALLNAMKRGCVIRFFGDVNQLPPIGSSSPFAIDLKKFPSVTLTQNFRSTDGIIAVADKIIRNRVITSNDKVVVQRVGVSEGSNAVLALAKEVDFTNDRAQIICPTNTTKHGCNNLNLAIQQRYNPEKDKIKIFSRAPDGSIFTRAFKRGDKILWTKNDYDLSIMNGSLGRVLDFDEDTGTIWINVDDKDIEVPSQAEGFNPTTGQRFTYDPRQRLDLGYAISTHKSQGSQFPFVCFAISRSRAATRQNVYTAVTRAQERLYIVNIGGALTHAVNNVVDIMKEPS